MVYKSLIRISILGVVASGIIALAGCKSPDYKQDADERVYNIIDRGWKEDFGPKTNYKISDVNQAGTAIQIEKTLPQSGILTLPGAVALATAHNRQYQFQKEELYVRALDLRLEQHNFEAMFFGGAAVGYAKNEDDELVSSEAGVGFNRTLASGAVIGTRLAASWVDILTGDLRSGLTSIFSVSVTQPLLRGSDPLIVRENLTQAERDTLYQIRLFNRFRQTFVVEIINQYYQVLLLLDAVENAESNYNTLRNVYERTEKLANAGRLPQFELEQARQDMLQAEDELIKAKKDYKQLLDEFKIILSLPVDLELKLDEKELYVLRDREMIMPDFKEDEVLETAMNRRLDLANSADAVDDAQRKVTVAADALRAGLNLTAATNVTSDTGTDFTVLRSQNADVAAGLNLDLPLDRVLEQNVYRKALITLTQRQRDYEQASDTVVLEVRKAYRDLTEAAERYKVLAEELQLAKKRFENTFLLLQYSSLQYSRTNTRDVLDAQEDLFDAQNDATEALINYNVATLNFYRDTGVLQLRPDGMWQY